MLNRDNTNIKDIIMYSIYILIGLFILKLLLKITIGGIITGIFIGGIIWIILKVMGITHHERYRD